MTVAIIGVGVDDTNSDPYPTVYEDGTFEYIPIPEAHDSTESKTYASVARHPKGGSLAETPEGDEPLAGALDKIQPSSDGAIRTGTELEKHPLHHDPNFSALTYGEVKTNNRNQLLQLDATEDDVVAFYTGLTDPTSNTPHRYIIGYFTVNEIIDFAKLLPENPPLNDDDRVPRSALPDDTRHEIVEKLEANSANAHVKRYQASGTIDPNLLIVDGTKPGGLLETAYPISQTVPGGHAFTEDTENRLNVLTTASHRETGFLGGFKKPHRLNLSGNEFISIIS
ncbi:hypothetical protein EFA46_009115 [Halarchaeum sp. CBA1220]|uniref:Nmad3 family putative nucleotide modification protein n=1 Tax=Halarchaeum sp. CBA1220 TaxID=1853682 RepID=UPI0011CE4FC2|nr:hypothetical protein [Halarchaeum sp. CBA1220]QLC34360.1 hypothetical protein EFA46_009115 [Halarchaeum sp. CBA1220]